MAWSAELGRVRTKLGKWMEKEGVTQAELHNWSGVSRPTITSLCGNLEYIPTARIKRTIVAALNRNGFDVEEINFW